MRWFWNNHAVHHTPNTLNLSAAFRIGVLSKLTDTAFFFLPPIWLGVAPRTVFAVLTLNLLYQFWNRGQTPCPRYSTVAATDALAAIAS